MSQENENENTELRGHLTPFEACFYGFLTLVIVVAVCVCALTGKAITTNMLVLLLAVLSLVAGWTHVELKRTMVKQSRAISQQTATAIDLATSALNSLSKHVVDSTGVQTQSILDKVDSVKQDLSANTEATNKVLDTVTAVVPDPPKTPPEPKAPHDAAGEHHRRRRGHADQA